MSTQTAPATTTSQTWTWSDLIIACIAREFHGEVIATGATLHSYLAARVAKALYESDLAIVGGSLAGFDCAIIVPQVLNDEFVCAHTSPAPIDWMEQWDLIAADKLRIFLGPAQIDRHGNSNISVLGDWSKPKVQLVGSRGIPDDVVRISELYFHVVQHSPRTFVEKVDFVCGLGYGEERKRLGLTTGLPRRVVSDLGVFGFDADRGHMVIESLHPGVSLESCQERTGFEWPPSDGSIPITQPPSEDEMHCIKALDPCGVRFLGTDDAPPDLLERIAAAEHELIHEARTTL
ncbi:MAG TPA: CoA-transferase [Actinomycetota bacterium]|nr:CoA-transferase [Actinomycetota bacterium]